MKIIISKSFEKSFDKHERKIQERIMKSVENLPDGDVKRLHGVITEPKSYRLRIGKYRVLFRMNEIFIYLDKLDSRGDIYKD